MFITSNRITNSQVQRWYKSHNSLTRVSMLCNTSLARSFRRQVTVTIGELWWELSFPNCKLGQKTEVFPNSADVSNCYEILVTPNLELEYVHTNIFQRANVFPEVYIKRDCRNSLTPNIDGRTFPPKLQHSKTVQQLAYIFVQVVSISSLPSMCTIYTTPGLSVTVLQCDSSLK